MSTECVNVTKTMDQSENSWWASWTYLSLSAWKKLSKRTQPMVMICVVIVYMMVMSTQMLTDSKQRRSASRGQAKIVAVSGATLA